MDPRQRLQQCTLGAPACNTALMSKLEERENIDFYVLVPIKDNSEGPLVVLPGGCCSRRQA